MSGYLLDTHVLLWWLDEPERLAAEAGQVISDGENPVFASAATAWEMAIKSGLGRLRMPSNLPEVLVAERIEVLPVSLPHALAVGNLPLLHRDPFDRMLIAQALAEGLTLVTRDPRILEYEVPVLRA